MIVWDSYPPKLLAYHCVRGITPELSIQRNVSGPCSENTATPNGHFTFHENKCCYKVNFYSTQQLKTPYFEVISPDTWSVYEGGDVDATNLGRRLIRLAWIASRDRLCVESFTVSSDLIGLKLTLTTIERRKITVLTIMSKR